MEAPATEESIVLNLDHRLRTQLAREPFRSFDCPFRTVSNTLLPDHFGESPLEQHTLHPPPPIHAPTPRPCAFNFLHQPWAEGTLNVGRNLDPNYSFILMSRIDMTSPEHSAARHEDIRKQQSRLVEVPSHGVILNLYDVVCDQMIFGTEE